MSNFVRDEIREAVREEVSRILGANDRTAGTDGGARNSTPTPSSSARPSKEALSFEEFYRSRETQRQQGFKPPKKKLKGNPPAKTTSALKKTKTVEVRVGIAAQSDGVFKLRRGKTHVITVNSSASREELVQKAITKHSSFDQSFDDSVRYMLLYPDFREVKVVPGTTHDFTLSAYKDAIGKEYKRLTFYLIPEDEFCEGNNDSEDESEECTLSSRLDQASTSSRQQNNRVTISDDEENERNLLSHPWWEQPTDEPPAGASGTNGKLTF